MSWRNNLSCSTTATMSPVRSARNYRLDILQQPTIGCSFEHNLLSRIGLAPPLILELQVNDTNDQPVDARDELPFLVCQCTLLQSDGSPANIIMLSSEPEHPIPASSSLIPNAQRFDRRIGRASGDRRNMPRGRTFRPVDSTGSSSANTVDATSVPQTSTPDLTAPSLERVLYGTTVAGPQLLESPSGSRKPYLLFPEISIRISGSFKLQCQLLRLTL